MSARTSETAEVKTAHPLAAARRNLLLLEAISRRERPAFFEGIVIMLPPLFERVSINLSAC
jgi:hypothetical protein